MLKIRPKSKQPVFTIPLGVLTLAYLHNIYMNSVLWKIGYNAESISTAQLFIEPFLWLVPVIFLLVWQKRTLTRVFSVPMLILTALFPMLRLIGFLSLGLLFEYALLEWLFVIFAVTVHPLAYMLMQTVFITALWFGFFSKDED